MYWMKACHLLIRTSTYRSGRIDTLHLLSSSHALSDIINNCSKKNWMLRTPS